MQFIITACMDFQINFFQKISVYAATNGTLALHAPSSVAIEGCGLSDHEFEPSISFTSLKSE